MGEHDFSRWLADALQGHGDDWSWAELAEKMSHEIEARKHNAEENQSMVSSG